MRLLKLPCFKSTLIILCFIFSSSLVYSQCDCGVGVFVTSTDNPVNINGCCSTDITVNVNEGCCYTFSVWTPGSPVWSVTQCFDMIDFELSGCPWSPQNWSVVDENGQLCGSGTVDCNPCNCDLIITQDPNDPCLLIACPGPNCADVGGVTWTTIPGGLPISQPIFPDNGPCVRLPIDENGLYCAEITDANGCMADACIRVDDCECEPLHLFQSYNPRLSVKSNGNGSITINTRGRLRINCNQCCDDIDPLLTSLVVTQDIRVVVIRNNQEIRVLNHFNRVRSHDCVGSNSNHGFGSFCGDLQVGDIIRSIQRFDIATTGCPYTGGPNPVEGSVDFVIDSQQTLDDLCN